MPDLLPSLVIAAPSSGSGKTTITAGLIAALTRRGYCIQPFKVGPDYVDPTYLTLAAGCTCRNLDSWLLPEGRWRLLFERTTRDASAAIIEGVMGLYDGARYDTETGCTAQIAKQLGAQVIVVIDAAKMARSAGAVALGLMMFDPQVQISGFIVNRAGSESHGRGVAAVIESATGKPCLGWIPRDQALAIPERHLGLIPTGELEKSQAFIEAANRLVEKYINLDAVAALLPQSQRPSLIEKSHLPTLGGDRPVIAVARDEAFSFTYPENLELLEEAGAQLTFFSPLRDTNLPAGTTGVILSGGFPEVYAAALSANQLMHRALKDAQKKNLPILAECGGLMYLTESIRDMDGKTWPMVGILPGASIMTNKLTLGYRLAEAAGDGPLLADGEKIRGHEFHYSIWENRPANLPPAFILHPPQGETGPTHLEGARVGNVWATYIHTHFLTMPSMAVRFVAMCRLVGEPLSNSEIDSKI
jgi:cobyrinic acid a,c-diamide synthase